MEKSICELSGGGGGGRAGYKALCAQVVCPPSFKSCYEALSRACQTCRWRYNLNHQAMLDNQKPEKYVITGSGSYVTTQICGFTVYMTLQPEFLKFFTLTGVLKKFSFSDWILIKFACGWMAKPHRKSCGFSCGQGLSVTNSHHQLNPPCTLHFPAALLFLTCTHSVMPCTSSAHSTPLAYKPTPQKLISFIPIQRLHPSMSEFEG